MFNILYVPNSLILKQLKFYYSVTNLNIHSIYQYTLSLNIEFANQHNNILQLSSSQQPPYVKVHVQNIFFNINYCHKIPKTVHYSCVYVSAHFIQHCCVEKKIADFYISLIIGNRVVISKNCYQQNLKQNEFVLIDPRIMIRNSMKRFQFIAQIVSL